MFVIPTEGHAVQVMHVVMNLRFLLNAANIWTGRAAGSFFPRLSWNLDIQFVTSFYGRVCSECRIWIRLKFGTKIVMLACDTLLCMQWTVRTRWGNNTTTYTYVFIVKAACFGRYWVIFMVDISKYRKRTHTVTNVTLVVIWNLIWNIVVARGIRRAVKRAFAGVAESSVFFRFRKKCLAFSSVCRA